MKRSSVIPKGVVGALFLIVAIIISFPCAGVFFNKTLGGGIFDLGDTIEGELRSNLPMEGDLSSIAACIGDQYSDSTGTLTKDSYYYLIPFDGKLMLLKTVSGTDAYEDVANLWRALSRADGTDETSVFVSGIIKKNSSSATEIYEQFSADNNLSEELIPYTLDCTKTVSQICVRFYISLIFYAGFAVCLYMVIHAIRKNNERDYTEHRRAMVQAVQDAKSGSGDDSNDDAMFGDNSQYSSQASRSSYSSQQTEQAYRPKFQSQGGEPINTTAHTDDSSDDYNGFFGG